MVFHPLLNPALLRLFGVFGLVHLVFGAVVVIGLFYLLIKLAGLADAMAHAKRTAS